MATGLKAYATDTMLPLLEDVAKVAPPELDPAVLTFRTQLQKLAETVRIEREREQLFGRPSTPSARCCRNSPTTSIIERSRAPHADTGTTSSRSRLHHPLRVVRRKGS